MKIHHFLFAVSAQLLAVQGADRVTNANTPPITIKGNGSDILIND
jgi:hypothetical protein